MSRQIALLLLTILFGNQPSTSEAHGDAEVTNLVTVQTDSVPPRDLTMITVEYPPGGSSRPHRHNAYVLVYVLEGELEMQVQGQPSKKLRAGQSFVERPDDVHVVSRNVSTKVPAKFLVVALKKPGVDLSIPVPER